LKNNLELELAVTKIGDLLLHNQITLNREGKSIENVKLKVPEYQRPYKWTGKNAIQLLDDILMAKSQNKETYRVGTLILYKTEDHQTHETIYEIVDGQQRVTTFVLLLHALGFGEIPFLQQSVKKNVHSATNIPNNFLALKRRIQNIKEEKNKEELKAYVQQNCELIVVITNEIAEAFQFFDSQNARGKKLYPHDLLKAYHLREMSNLDVSETEKVVKTWEDMDQKKLATLFSEYLYRLKEWTKGNTAWELNEKNIHKFKGVSHKDNYPYAQYYKGAFAYIDHINQTAMPFVSGLRSLKPFQLDTPVVAGKPFFDYAKHYFEILADIQNNYKYEGYFVNDNYIVKTLNLKDFKNGIGNGITRLLFDTALLLFVDRFCPEKPSQQDLDLLDEFLVFAFIWAYSLRAQYSNLGWVSAQSYIMGSDKINSFNIYKAITESDNPLALMSALSDKLRPLKVNELSKNLQGINDFNQEDSNMIQLHYLNLFKRHNFLEVKK
jgi:hypothetical protein